MNRGCPDPFYSNNLSVCKVYRLLLQKHFSKPAKSCGTSKIILDETKTFLQWHHYSFTLIISDNRL